MNNTVAASPGFVLKGWHVLLMFIAFFGVDIAVNTYFMVSAYKTFPGETSTTPYEDGLAYNATLAQRQAQAALGWRIAAGRDGPDQIRVDASDRSGAGLSGLKVSAHIERPATEAGQLDVNFTEVQPGLYRAKAPDLHGAWDIDVTVKDAQGRTATAERRVIAP